VSAEEVQWGSGKGRCATVGGDTDMGGEKRKKEKIKKSPFTGIHPPNTEYSTHTFITTSKIPRKC
jgi:hypothetical protein